MDWDCKEQTLDSVVFWSSTGIKREFLHINFNFAICARALIVFCNDAQIHFGHV